MQTFKSKIWWFVAKQNDKPMLKHGNYETSFKIFTVGIPNIYIFFQKFHIFFVLKQNNDK